MRYEIISGRTVEKRDVLMEISLDPTEKRRPRGKRRAKTAEDQVERNMREAVRRLARILNCNYQAGDLFMTLKYSDARLPECRQAAEREVRNFIQRVARAYKKATGKKLRWVLVTADRSSKTGKPVRLHHHVVMDPVAWDLIAKHWPDDQFSYRRLDGSGDYTGVARYMVLNSGYGEGKRAWSTSKGLEKPVFTAPKPVKEAGSYRVPREARVAEREIREDGERGFSAAYIRYVLPKPEEKQNAEFPDTAMRTGGRARSSNGAGNRAESVRCKGCGRLLGTVERGRFVNKHGKQVMRAALPVTVSCPKCGAENRVERKR